MHTHTQIYIYINKKSIIVIQIPLNQGYAINFLFPCAWFSFVSLFLLHESSFKMAVTTNRIWTVSSLSPRLHLYLIFWSLLELWLSVQGATWGRWKGTVDILQQNLWVFASGIQVGMSLLITICWKTPEDVTVHFKKQRKWMLLQITSPLSELNVC